MQDAPKATLPEGGKARRVYLLLRDEITGGRFGPGAVIPGEQKLAEQFAVSRVTIRRALDGLEADGLIARRAGSGTTVIGGGQAGPAISADMTTLIPQLVEMSARTEARMLSFAYGPPPVAAARALGLTEGQKVQTAIRVRLIEGQPFSHLTTHVPEAIARHYSEGDMATTPLFRLLERSGVRVDTGHQTVSAALASPDVADALEVSVGTALLSVRRVVRDADGRGVEYLSALYRPDMFRLEMDITRVGEGGARHWEPVIAPEAESEAAPA